RNEFRKRFSEIRIKEIECHEGLDFEEFGALHEGTALQNLDQFCHVSYEQDDRRFVSQAWNRLFRIKEQVVREYVMEFLSSFTFRDHIEELDEADTMVFSAWWGKEDKHSGKENVTLDDLFLLHSMDGGVGVDVPWHVAKFFSDKAKGYNGLGIGEMVAKIPEVAEDDEIRTIFSNGEFGKWRTDEERLSSRLCNLKLHTDDDNDNKRSKEIKLKQNDTDIKENYTPV
ncbi:hypothetical protein Tco_1332698, partial [Tanacetum coccineum]